jgi:hypothetical protein
MALGRLGRQSAPVHLRERHRPDGANHDRTGVFVMTGLPASDGQVDGLDLVDVGPRS